MAKKLSNRLLGLQVWFEECLEGRAEFTMEGARAFAAGLNAAVSEASDLEDAAVLAARVEAALRSVYADRDQAAEATPEEAPPSLSATVINLRTRLRRVPLRDVDGGAA